jgi:tetratricopeptide (TPR) repeat protein
MLEPVRAFAAEELSRYEGPVETSRRAIEWLRSLIEGGLESGRVLDRLHAEIDNIRVLVDFAFTDDISRAVNLVRGLENVWVHKGYADEGRRYVERLLDLPLEDRQRASALVSGGFLALSRGDGSAAVAYLTEARGMLQALGERHGYARVTSDLSYAKLLMNDIEEARVLSEEAVAVARECGSEPLEVQATSTLATCLRLAKEFAAALSVFEHCLAISRRNGDTTYTAVLLTEMGVAARAANQPASARRYLEEAIDITAVNGDIRTRSSALGALAVVELGAGHFDEASRWMLDARDAALRGSDPRTYTETFMIEGMVALQRGDAETARATLIECLQRCRDSHGRPVVPALLALAASLCLTGAPATAMRLASVVTRLLDGLQDGYARSVVEETAASDPRLQGLLDGDEPLTVEEVFDIIDSLDQD